MNNLEKIIKGHNEKMVMERATVGTKAAEKDVTA